MILQNCYRLVSFLRGPCHFRTIKTKVNNSKSILDILCKYLYISKNEAQYIYLKHPVVRKLDEAKIEGLLQCLHELGYTKEVLFEVPSIFSLLPVTLRFRFKVLSECGLNNVSPTHLTSYFTIMKQKTIRELKESGLIHSHINIENRLASYMTQWPTSLTTLIHGDSSEITLYTLRLKIIQRYLELVLDLTEDEFYRGLETYPTIKHRPLEVINEALTILQSEVMMPTHKIKSNLYLVHLDPENLKQIIYKFQSIGGIDIKEVIRMHPKLAIRSFQSMVETRKVLQEYGISNEAQRRCFTVYTLGSTTVRERLSNAKTIPEYQIFFNHPRFLKMIYYKTAVNKRLMNLLNKNKKCSSLNVLSGSSAHYEKFEKTPGDKLGKGQDLIFCISQALGNTFSKNGIRKTIKRHPFWANIPLVQVKFVCQQLSMEFTPSDIYENCTILLYPWDKIKKQLKILNGKENPNELLEPLQLTKLNDSQKLSLVLYMLERNYYFTGNGIWSEEKTNSIESPNVQELKSLSIQ